MSACGTSASTGPGRGGGGGGRAARSQVVGQVVLLQGVGLEAVRHRVEVVVAYPADEALGLEDEGGTETSAFRRQDRAPRLTRAAAARTR